MSERFLYDYQFRQIDQMKMKGKLVGASQNGKIIVSVENKKVYIYHINDDDQFSTINTEINFKPLIIDFYT